MCLNPYVEANSFISLESYCGPLSLITVLGIPCLENTDFIAVITLDEVVVVNLMTWEK